MFRGLNDIANKDLVCEPHRGCSDTIKEDLYGSPLDDRKTVELHCIGLEIELPTSQRVYMIQYEQVL